MLRVYMCHHLTPIKRSKVCILEPGLFPAIAFLTLIADSHAQQSRAIYLHGPLSTVQASYEPNSMHLFLQRILCD